MVQRVKEAHSYDQGGVPIVMRVGALVDDDDPRIKGREQFYEPAEDAAVRTSAVATETATAAPGERRSTARKRADS